MTGVTCYLSAALLLRMLGLSSPAFRLELLSNTLLLLYHNFAAKANAVGSYKPCR